MNPPARIVDVGGVAGGYSAWLSELGYEVHLVDATPRPVEEAQKRNARLSRPIASISLVDARRLPQPDASAEVVLVMGPLAENPNWRFILTTREYILNIARQRYEAFAHPRIEFRMCVINLSDYTRPARAKILYNHIFFSDLPKSAWPERGLAERIRLVPPGCSRQSPGLDCGIYSPA